MTNKPQTLTLYFCTLSRGEGKNKQTHTYLCLKNTTDDADGYGSVYEHMHVVNENDGLKVIIGGGLNINEHDNTKFSKITAGNKDKMLSLWEDLKNAADGVEDKTMGHYFPPNLQNNKETIAQLLAKVDSTLKLS